MENFCASRDTSMNTKSQVTDEKTIFANCTFRIYEGLLKVHCRKTIHFKMGRRAEEYFIKGDIQTTKNTSKCV